MRGYNDLPAELGRFRRASEPHPAARGETMSTLCPGAFDGFAAFKPGPDGCPAALKLVDPAGRLRGAKAIDEETAKARSSGHRQRVLSVVVSGGGAGADAYGSGPVRVVVPGYRQGAEAYYLENRSG